jgi:hypothetical protein
LHVVASGQVSAQELLRIQKFKAHLSRDVPAKVRITDRWWDEPWERR